MRRAVLVLTVAATTGVAGLAPAFAAVGKHKHVTLKGTWSFTDTTPDPTVEVAENAMGAPQGCRSGKLPAGPLDVNSHVLKVPTKGFLTVVGHNKLDWAMEVDDSHGNYVGGSDGGTPNVAEGVTGLPVRPGSYTVIYCNLTGEPQITADYLFKG
jgi:hypothetical protein